MRVRLAAAMAVLWGALLVPAYVEDTWSLVIPQPVAVYTAVSSVLLAVGSWLDLTGRLGGEEGDATNGDR